VRHCSGAWRAIALAAFTIGRLAYAAPGDGARVLFIGNSLTTVNDVPGLVARLAAASHQRFDYRTVAFDGYSLEDHWNRGEARRAIAGGGWSIVVLQQGPSALPESRVQLRASVRRFDLEIRRAGARTALYMVWPSAERLGDFEAVRTSYDLAARDVGGLLLPAGQAWREAWRLDSHLPLYGADRFHPTMAGSYVAALVMFEAFFERQPMPVAVANVSAAQSALLQQAAHAAVTRIPR